MKALNLFLKIKKIRFFFTWHFIPFTLLFRHQKNILKNMKKNENNLNLDSVPHQKEGEGWTKMVQENADYASMVAAMDENVGRILNALKEQGLDENTWIIFTSDNGGLSTLNK